MLNSVILIGRLTADPELRYTQQNTPVTNFRIAVERNTKNDNNNSNADFFNIVTWKQLAENVNQYTQKGSLVAVNGRLQSRTYDDNGQRKTIVEVVAFSVQFLRQPNQQNSQVQPNQQQSYSNYGQPANNQQQQQGQQQQYGQQAFYNKPPQNNNYAPTQQANNGGPYQQNNYGQQPVQQNNYKNFNNNPQQPNTAPQTVDYDTDDDLPF